MTPFYVADVGNTRIKVGRSDAGRLVDAAPLTADDALPFDPHPGSEWFIAGVDPARRDRFADSMRQRSQVVRLVTDYRELPIRVEVDAPERVGIDRLLNAIGARGRVPVGTAVLVVSVGTAVTVDLVAATGAFRGGVIFPGFRLMARALRDYTAQLPLVESFEAPPPPGRDTHSAIAAGIRAAVTGGIQHVIDDTTHCDATAVVVLTGGDAGLIGPLKQPVVTAGPFLALEGLRLTATGRR